MRSIQWNPKGLSLLAPLQRDAFERDQPIRRFDGAIYTDADGRVWFARGEEKKHIGDESGGRYVDTPTSAPEAPGATPDAALQADRSAKTKRRADRKKPSNAKRAK